MAVIFAGIVVIVLGIMGLVNGNKKPRGEKIAARVQNCKTSSAEIMGQTVFCYDVTLEIFAPRGTMIKTIQDKEPYEVGQYTDVYYEADKDAITLKRYAEGSGTKAPWAVIGFGVLIILLGVSLDLMQKSEDFAEVMKSVLMYGTSILFAGIGIFFIVIKRGKRKNQMPNCHEIQGTLVDYKKEANTDNSGWLYRPIYSYYVNGMEYRMESSVAGDGDRHREIGRKVTLVVNDVTKEVYCLEDVKTENWFGIIFLVVGIAMLFATLYQDFL